MGGGPSHPKTRSKLDRAERDKHSQHVGNFVFVDKVDSKRVGRLDDSLAAEHVFAAANDFLRNLPNNGFGDADGELLVFRKSYMRSHSRKGLRSWLVRSNLFEDLCLQRLTMLSLPRGQMWNSNAHRLDCLPR